MQHLDYFYVLYIMMFLNIMIMIVNQLFVVIVIVGTQSPEVSCCLTSPIYSTVIESASLNESCFLRLSLLIPSCLSVCPGQLAFLACLNLLSCTDSCLLYPSFLLYGRSVASTHASSHSFYVWSSCSRDPPFVTFCHNLID